MIFAAIATDIVIRYGSRLALDRSSFGIPGEALTAVIGPNGSGKSTVLNALAALVVPAEGHLEVLGTQPALARADVSYVLQTTKINEALPVTVAEVVTMGRYSTSGSFGRLGSSDRRAVATAMERLGIAHLAHRHLRELSGGERQRVFVAQGLAQERSLLLLDEPFSGLDLVSARAIEEILGDERKKGRAVVLTTHSLAEAQAADHVLLLAGRVVAEGSPAEALTLTSLRAAYGSAVVETEEGGLLVDDAAHAPADVRHVHRDRSIHPEPPGSGIHTPRDHQS